MCVKGKGERKGKKTINIYRQDIMVRKMYQLHIGIMKATNVSGISFKFNLQGDFNLCFANARFIQR